MIIKATEEFERKAEKLCRRNTVLGKKLSEKLRLLVSSPKHPSLRLHKLFSNDLEAWSISLDMKIRVIFVFRDYGILLVDIGNHDQVY